MKKYSVIYCITNKYESVVKAKNYKEAMSKVKEVLDINDDDITDVWEIIQ